MPEVTEIIESKEQKVPDNIQKYLDRADSIEGIIPAKKEVPQKSQEEIDNETAGAAEAAIKLKENEGKTQEELDVEAEEAARVAEAAKNSEEQNPIVVSEEDVVKFLKSKNPNLDIDSVADLMGKIAPNDIIEETDEQIALRKLEVNKWAIENKIVNPKKIEEFEKDSKLSKLDVAFKVYLEKRKGDLNESQEPLTEAEIRADFEDENYLYLEDTDPKRIRATENQELVADIYMRNNYKELADIEGQYEASLLGQEKNTNLNRAAEAAKTNLVTDGMSFTIKDELGKPIVVNMPISKKQIDEIQVNISEVESASDVNEVQEVIKAKYLLKNIEGMLHEVATSYHSQKVLDKKAESIGVEKRKEEFSKRTGGVPENIQRHLDEADKRGGDY